MPARHLYVLPLFCEDLAKIGISVDPLARVRSFSARYYEGFDLARSVVVRFEDGGDARRLETALHRRLRRWKAPAPLTVATAAGGASGWYAGWKPGALEAGAAWWCGSRTGATRDAWRPRCTAGCASGTHRRR